MLIGRVSLAPDVGLGHEGVHARQPLRRPAHRRLLLPARVQKSPVTLSLHPSMTVPLAIPEVVIIIVIVLAINAVIVREHVRLLILLFVIDVIDGFGHGVDTPPD